MSINTPNITLFLQHPEVKSWTINKAQIQRLTAQIPGCDIQSAETEMDFLNMYLHADIVITWKFKKEWYQGNPRLKAVMTPAAGHDWVEADPSGKVKNFYGSWHGKIMRESLLSMILYFNRRIRVSLAKQQYHQWDRTPYDTIQSLSTQTVIIIGYGHIGVHCSQLLKAFGCEVIGVKKDPFKLPSPSTADKVIAMQELTTILPDADHIVFLLPNGKETDNIFTKSHFSLLKPTACIYNLGRGNCYDPDILYKVLKNADIFGAGLDVFDEEPLPQDSPFWDLPNVLITPHSSALAQQYLDFYLDEAIPHIQRLLK